MNKQLKIIAIRPLEGCVSHILKVLKPEMTYFLYNNYEMCDNDQFIRNKGEIIPFDFFRLDVNSPNISISAIVGKNGDGKSSLVELMIRILNNFAKIYRFGGDTNNLVYISGINAKLYFSVIDGISETFYKIHIENDDIDNSITLYKEKEPIWSYGFNIENNQPINISDLGGHGQKEKELFVADYFFTLVANYSLYAYNSYDFEEEWEWLREEKPDSEQQVCWLDSVFHKNDGYQTPVVLHPFRKDGNVDINTEKELSTQRLLSLFLTDDTSPNSFRWVNERQFVEDIIYTLHQESILDTKTYYNYFRNSYYYDAYRDQSAPALKELDEKIQKLPNNTSLKDEIEEEIKREFVQPLIAMDEYLVKYNNIFNRAIKVFDRLIKDLKSERDNSQNIDRKSDIRKFSEQVREVCKHARNYIDKQILVDLDTYAENIWQRTANFNFNQYFQIVLVIFIQEQWCKKIPYLKDSIEKLNKLENELGSKAFDYLTYKTLSIIKKYPQYDDANRFAYFQGYLFNNATMGQHESSQYEKAIEDILRDTSHITLKIRQTLNLLDYNFHTHTRHDAALYNDFISLFRLSSNKKEIQINKQREVVTERIRKLNLSEYYNKIKPLCKSDSELIDFLPSPIFETDAIIVSDKEMSRLSNLSSGEKQFLGATSAVLYHLRNINSVIPREIDSIIDKKQIYQYKHINIIFEEIELYFHPEFQRVFIKNLLDNIQQMNFKNITSINILFVTHSPFILSDIPISNVLFLEKGEPRTDMINKRMNTFSSNIYDLISEGFFLDAPMGEFAANLIKKIIEDIRNDKINSQNRNQYETLINLIGDEFLKSELKIELYKKNGDEKELEIVKLENRLKLLKEE